ncbi:GapA-binding peptide SR1P [Metabacillus sp. RGM 3146]
MGTIVCKECNSTISHFDDEKVSTLYGKCSDCDEEKKDRR